MLDRATIDRLLDLPAEDRLALADALWESLATDGATVPIPDWQRELLDKRIAEDDADTSPGETWDVLRRRIEKVV